ncbi:hypothetical protein ACF08W_28645 [Streptomyces sp. NPDC015144]|uniref:hypothetical protein n=1 Tax=Streptomyces sp. NPDC015144 TaxID=3364944 RepID=UPI0036FB3C88
MTTVNERADELAESACLLADSGPWSPAAVDDALTAMETLSEALAERLGPDAARHLAVVLPALARARDQIGSRPTTPTLPAERRARRRIGLGPNGGQALAETYAE